MTIVGIVAEYNPFHHGHGYMLAKVRQIYPSAAIVAVMSGSVTQRGEAAITDKWQRARMAVAGGCDLVLELPTAFVLSSAQNFAMGGVWLLERLGCVEVLAFGAEYAETAGLQRAADCLDGAEAQARIRRAVLAGHSYAAAARQVISALTPIGCPGSNTVLAVEYLRALRRLASRMKPLAVERRGGHHLSEIPSAHYAGAAAIRRLWRAGVPWPKLAAFLPETSWQILSAAKGAVVNDNLYLPWLARLALLTPTEIAAHIAVGEGLENRLLDAARRATDMADFVRLARSKRYPVGRIGRAIWGVLLGFKRAEQENFLRTGPLYGRVLAFNAVGQEILRRSKSQGKLPFISRVGAFLNRRDFTRAAEDLSDLQRMLRLDIRAGMLHNLAGAEPNLTPKDYLISPINSGNPLGYQTGDFVIDGVQSAGGVVNTHQIGAE